MTTKVESSSLAHNIRSKSDFKDEFVDGKYVKYLNTDYKDTERSVVIHGTLDKGKNPEKVEEEKKNDLPPVGFFSLFRYSSSCDKALIIIGAIVTIVTGASGPMVNVIIGKVIDKLIDYDVSNKNMTNVNKTITTDEFLQSTEQLCVILAVIGCASFVCNYMMVCFFNMAAANQAIKIKCMFFASILKQDIGWYDTTETGDFASRITGDLTRVQDGLGEKIPICMNLIISTFLSIGTAFYYSWKLALFSFCFMPLMTFAMGFLSKLQASVSREEMQAYGIASAVAEEVLSAIRTVVSFGGEMKEIQRYQKCLVPARKKGIKRGLITALSACIAWVCSFLGSALCFWYGVKLVVED